MYENICDRVSATTSAGAPSATPSSTTPAFDVREPVMGDLFDFDSLLDTDYLIGEMG